MLDKLIELGIREIDLNNIKEFINNDNIEDFNKILELLKSLNCHDYILRNIIVGNPFILERDYDSIKSLIDYMQSKGFKSLNLLFDSYPLFLNKDAFEIEEYLNNHQDKNMEDIIDELESNPTLIEE